MSIPKKKYLLLALLLLLIGCVNKEGVVNFMAKPGLEITPNGTALIRPATDDEKTERKSVLALRIFVNPRGVGNMAMLEEISSPNGDVMNLSSRNVSAIRVPPGQYFVKAICTQSSYPAILNMHFGVAIEARAGKQYLLECTGITAATTRMVVHEI
jgi:hypothetical protein